MRSTVRPSFSTRMNTPFSFGGFFAAQKGVLNVHPLVLAAITGYWDHVRPHSAVKKKRHLQAVN